MLTTVRTSSLTLVCVLLAAPLLNGCVNSPENPTAILAAVGALSGAVVMIRRRK